MALKPDAKDWIIKEQIVEDLATGLTFQFEFVENDEGSPMRLKIYGDLPFGNREILFESKGRKNGSGTLVSGHCKPAWLTKIDEKQ